MTLKEVFLAGNFTESLPAGSSRYLTQFYEQASEIEQAYGSYRDALKRGDIPQARAIQSAEREKLALHPLVERVRRDEGILNTRIKMIESSRSLSGAQKRVQIDALKERKHALARQVSESRLAAH